MITTMCTELTLPNDAQCLRMARGYVRELAGLAGLATPDAEKLILAADEACTNTVEHAFEPGETGTYTLKAEIAPGVLTVSILDRGLPFDASGVSEYRPPVSADAVAEGGLGLYLIRQAVDEARWINHGRAGKELRLTKRRPEADVTAQLPEAALAPYRDDEPKAPLQEYTIRRLRPDEAIWVAQCVYRAYGYTYFNDDLYYPERIVHQNAQERLVSVVAVTESGEVVGLYALERPDLGAVAESGQAVVAPAHRGRQLMERMRTFLEAEGRRVGLRGIFGEPVTNHVFSQRMNESFGTRLCGVFLGSLPRATQFKKIDDQPLTQRVSCMRYYKYLVPPETAIIHAPPHHQAILERLYGSLGAPVEFRSAGGSAHREEIAGPGDMEVVYNATAGIGTIRVRRVGADTGAEIRRAQHDLCVLAGAEVVYLELPLAQPGTPAVCEAAESAGFFLAGLGPLFAPDGDVLALQYLAVDLDTARMQVQNPLGRELLAYVDAERVRVKRAV